MRLTLIILGLAFWNAVAQADSIYGAFQGLEIDKFDANGNPVGSWSGPPHGLNDSPLPLTLDAAGNLYAGNSQETIVKLDPSGNWSTFADTGLLFNPSGLAFDSSGNLYAASRFNRSIIKIDASGHGSIFVLWGGMDTSPDNGGLAFDRGGNLYLASRGDGEILKFDTSGNLSVFANVPAKGLAFDSSGSLYASVGSTVLKFDSSGNGSLFAAGLQGISSLAFDSSGALYGAAGPTIVKIDPSGHNSIFASGSGFFVVGIAVQPVPEPSTISMLAIGMGAILVFHRLKRMPLYASFSSDNA